MSVQILLLISELDGGRFAIQCVSPVKIIDINALPDVSLSNFLPALQVAFLRFIGCFSCRTETIQFDMIVHDYFCFYYLLY